MRSNYRFSIIFLALSVVLVLVTLIAFGLLGTGSPTLIAPSPLPLFLAYVYIGPPAFAIPALLFIAWAWPLSRGEARYPVRSAVLCVVLVAMSATWYVLGEWRKYYGPALAFIWAGLVAASVATAIMCRRRPSFWLNAAAHWLLFAWLASYAFPWLGEVP